MALVSPLDVHFCVGDSLARWTPCCLVLEETGNEELLILQIFAPDEGGEQTLDDSTNSDLSGILLEVRINTKCCVLGTRTQAHFMRGVFDKEIGDEFALLATDEMILNFKGERAVDMLQQVHQKRCKRQVELYGFNLDSIFYVCSDIGEVHADETEFLLACTPYDISIVSLQRGCVSRCFPIIKIRSFCGGSESSDARIGGAPTVVLKIGRMQHGNRSYSFRSSQPHLIIQAIKRQICIISGIIDEENMLMRGTNILSSETVDQGTENWRILQEKHSSDLQDPSTSASLPTVASNQSIYQNILNKSHSYPTESLNNSQNIRFSQPCPVIATRKLSQVSETVSSGSDYLKPDVGSTEIYPFLDTSFSQSSEFCYETLSAEINPKVRVLDYQPSHTPDTEDGSSLNTTDDGTSSARSSEVFYQEVELEESDYKNVVYQEVDIRVSRFRSIRNSRRRSSSSLKPSFVSYIIGGGRALEKLRASWELVDKSTGGRDIEGSGVYCRLFDTELLEKLGVRETEDEDLYDTLKH